jgi:acylphosphatase
MKRREQSLHAFSFLQLQQNLKVITATKENNMIKAEIIVKGNVQMVGFRTFIKNLADSLNIKGYAKNLDDGSVNIVCESEKNNIEELINEIREKPPSFASVVDISVEYADYTGEYVSFERTDGDIPKEATLGDLLGVMQSFDTKAELLVGILNSMHSTLKGVKGDTSLMLGKQDQMLGKQNTTIQILKGVKDDTSQIKGIKEDTEVMKDKLTSSEEIHMELLDLRVKYNQLSDDVTEIKIAISELS